MVDDLLFCSPEEQGLDSARISKFIERLKERKTNLHSFMLVRNGKILTEAYYNIDPLVEPWKIWCTNCQTRFPSNDFALLYQRGLDENGRYIFSKEVQCINVFGILVICDVSQLFKSNSFSFEQLKKV